jgi:zinc/manganese transport system substrate-binding protein
MRSPRYRLRLDFDNENDCHFHVRAALVALTVLLGAGLVGGACSSSASSHASNDGRIRVVAGANAWGDLAREIGGDHVRVTSLLDDPQADPHLFELDARAAERVAGAQLVIENGLGYDEFMHQLVSVTTAKDRVVLRAADVLHRSGTDTNPHLWYDVPAVGTVAQSIADALTRIDPAHRADYEANLAAVQHQLAGVQNAVAHLKATHAGAPVATTEPVADYLLADAGLDVRSPQGFVRAVEDGNEPSPADANTMDHLLATRAVDTLVYNSQATSPTTDRVRAAARADGIPVVPVTELVPKDAASYPAWMLDEVAAIQGALDGRR